jgi:hypothetical protein
VFYVRMKLLMLAESCIFLIDSAKDIFLVRSVCCYILFFFFVKLGGIVLDLNDSAKFVLTQKTFYFFPKFYFNYGIFGGIMYF